MTKEEQFGQITFLLPCYNEAESLESLILTFNTFWERNQSCLIFVNDGSVDKTLDVLRAFQKKTSLAVTIVDLSRNFGKDRAILAGLQFIPDDANLLLMDSDGQHDLGAVQVIASEYFTGQYDIVYGVRSDREYQSKVSRFASVALYKLLNLTLRKYKHDPQVGDFFLADSKVLSALRNYGSHRPFWKGYYSYIGFRSTKVKIHVASRLEGKSKFNAKAQISLALDSFTGFTTWPMRFLFVFGAVILGICLLIAFYIVGRYIVTGVTASGFYTVILAIMFFGSLNLMAFGVMAEYLINTIIKDNGLPAVIIRDVFETHKLG